MQQIDLNILFPTTWNDLNDEQLRYFFGLLAKDYTSDAIKTYCLFRWSGLKVLYRTDEKHVIVSFKNDLYKLEDEQIANLIFSIKWMDELPSFPCQLKSIGGNSPCAADFQQVPFEVFLYCDNLYQGYLHTKNDSLLADMARVLYDDDSLVCDMAEKISVFYWFASLKHFFSLRFKHFFQPIGNTDSNLMSVNLADKLQESMDSQIRALTKGDITKEEVIKKTDTWRALTELDAQAKEYEELKRIYNK